MAISMDINILNTKWRTPLSVGAGPLTRDDRSILKVAECPGVGAIFTKTVYYKSDDTPRPTMAKTSCGGMINFDWSGTGIDEWERYLKGIKGCELPVIANFWDDDLDCLLEMGYRLEKAGVVALEVPLDASLSLDEVKKIIVSLKKAVGIPIIGKIGGLLPDVENYCRVLEDAGVAAIAGINTIGPGLVLEAGDARKPFLGNSYGLGYISGRPVREIALATAALVAKTAKVPFIAGGGIANARDVLDFLAVGANAVFIVTEAIFKGLDIFDKIGRELETELEERGFSAPSELVGTAKASIKKRKNRDIRIPRIDRDTCSGCGICVRCCIYDSLVMEEGKPVHKDSGGNCFGCGLCRTVCPKGAISILLEGEG